MTISVTHSTPADDTFSAEGAAAWDAGHVVTGLGTMATQDANNVAITGGSISGVTVSGVVTSVSGTAPIASSGGTTLAISISQATTSTDGYLSSTDWNTFNGKQPAGSYLTTVTADAPLSGSGTSGSHLVISQAGAASNGYLSSTDWNTFNGKQPAGTYVTSVGATSPVTSTGGTTPTIAMPAADTTTSGYLTSTDWNTFNSKGSGTVTSVSGTAPIASTGGATPAISISQATTSTSGYLSSTDWNTFNSKVSMVYPGAGIPNSTGSAWGTSYTTTGSGTVVALATGPTLSAPVIDGANPYIQFNNGAAVALAAGRMWYDGSTGSFNLGMGNGNITQQVGEEIFVYGKASAAITEGQLIVKTGTVGASGVITFGPSPTGLTVNDGIIGVATENIASGSFGRITYFGVVHGIDTSGSSVGETWANNDTLYYNPSYAGGMTNVKPVAPNIKYAIATVINAGPGGSGSIQVDLQPGSTLGGTDSNVQLNGVASGNVLTYNGTYWYNAASVSGGTF